MESIAYGENQWENFLPIFGELSANFLGRHGVAVLARIAQSLDQPALAVANSVVVVFDDLVSHGSRQRLKLWEGEGHCLLLRLKFT